jgi:hypothetical protein
MITDRLPADIDLFLSDIMQMFDVGLKYEHISRFRPDRATLAELRKLQTDYTLRASEEGEAEVLKIVHRVAALVKDGDGVHIDSGGV